jgi:hypothetical protein
METLLAVVTFVALALALGMSVVAWRLLRHDRQRSDAHVEALQAAADADEGPLLPMPRPAPASADRYLTLDEVPPPVVRRRQPAVAPEVSFGAAVRSGVPVKRWLAWMLVGVGATVVALAASVGYRPAFANSLTASMGAAPSSQPGRPLALLSLRHAIAADGTFTVTGLIENPSDGQLVNKAVAVVYLFDRTGTYLAAGRAAIDFSHLQPGDESPFVVRVPHAGPVSRYRVGFRTEEGAVLAHIDRRGEQPGNTTGGAVEPDSTTRPAAAQPRVQGRP